jgi:ribonuclease HII
MNSRQLSPNEAVPPIFLHDENLRKRYPLIAGLDEAGRGPLAGPVVAAAVVLPSGTFIDGVRDSKQIPDKQRKKVFWKIIKTASDVGVGIVGADLIDSMNILRATKRAMELAVQDLAITPDLLLIDALNLPDVAIEQQSPVKGESVSALIAAASVVAKVVRDDIMLGYHEQYPDYNFMGHKGYSTREHMKNIHLFGPCRIHRKSFRKVMDIRLPLGEGEEL